MQKEPKASCAQHRPTQRGCGYISRFSPTALIFRRFFQAQLRIYLQAPETGPQFAAPTRHIQATNTPFMRGSSAKLIAIATAHKAAIPAATLSSKRKMKM